MSSAPEELGRQAVTPRCTCTQGTRLGAGALVPCPPPLLHSIHRGLCGVEGGEGREVEEGFLPRSWHNPIPSNSQGQMTPIAKVSFLK